MHNLSRRKIIPALAFGGASLLPRRAEADTLFTSFAFRATGAPTARTMPDRLSEIKNVKNFGATGDGGTDDTAAIQAAINWTSGANRGTIYFPLGTYHTTAALTFNYDGDLSICFRGDPGATISALHAGYVFDRHLATPNNTYGGRTFEGLTILNGHSAGGGIRIGSSKGAVIRDCRIQAFIGVTTEDAVGQSSENVYIENCSITNNGALTGSHYIIIGGGGAIQGCILSGADVAVRAYGKGLFCAGNRLERNNTAWLLGLDSGGNNVGLSGVTLTTNSAEGCWTAIDFAGLVDGFALISMGHLGHNLDNAGMVGNIQPTQYSLRIRADCARNGVIQGFGSGNWHDIAAIAIENATSRANVLFRETQASVGAGAGVNWILPTNAYTASFRNCNTASLWTYAQLPAGGNVLEGDEFDIANSNTAVWGATVAGGGANRIRTRYNGTNWTVVGK